jgi:riboflavin kinase/FMN adenylyltransferase
MEIVNDIYNFSGEFHNTAIAIGNFDGVHMGHQLLIRTLVEKSKKEDLSSGVLTFNVHPRTILKPKQSPLILTTKNEKIKLISQLGVDKLFFADFNAKLSTLSPEEFVRNMLIRKLDAKVIVVGSDFTFGFKGAGNCSTLKKLAAELNYELLVVERFYYNNMVTSSTEIRQKILSGMIEEANMLLGRPYQITAKVVSGAQIGRKLGFPTANLNFEKNKALPSDGVYIVQIEIDGQVYYGVANVGYKPTFLGSSRNLEVHIFAFNNNIYEREITVGFLKKLRDEIGFASPQQLSKQIEKDSKEAKLWLQNNGFIN